MTSPASSTSPGRQMTTANPHDLRPRLALAIDAAKQAGDLTLRYFQRANYSVEQKGDGSPVTTADREAERLIRRLVAGRFPSDGVLGEEFGEEPSSSGFRWLIDPIDGTASFVRGVPLYGTLIGVEHLGIPAAGVIHMPALAETVHAATGLGAVHELPGRAPAPARVSREATVATSLFCTTSYDYYGRRGLDQLFLTLCRAFASMRGWSDCYGYLLLATGRADAVIEPGVHPWDVAAIVPIIQEAGGRSTDWNGSPSIYTGNNIATNGLIHDETLALLRPR